MYPPCSHQVISQWHIRCKVSRNNTACMSHCSPEEPGAKPNSSRKCNHPHMTHVGLRTIWFGVSPCLAKVSLQLKYSRIQWQMHRNKHQQTCSPGLTIAFINWTQEVNIDLSGPEFIHLWNAEVERSGPSSLFQFFILKVLEKKFSRPRKRYS